jgi:hypothetical protein
LLDEGFKIKIHLSSMFESIKRSFWQYWFDKSFKKTFLIKIYTTQWKRNAIRNDSRLLQVIRYELYTFYDIKVTLSRLQRNSNNVNEFNLIPTSFKSKLYFISEQRDIGTLMLDNLR